MLPFWTIKSRRRKNEAVRRRPPPCLTPLEDRLVPAPAVPAFNSNPAAPATLYLDFDGHVERNWAGYGERTSIFGTVLATALGGPLAGLVTNLITNRIVGTPTTPVFDLDGNRNTFNAAELSMINEVCDLVAEDYAPFNINVTTVPPPNFNDGVALRISIGGTGSWSTIGGGRYGVALLNSFSNILDNTAFVFSENIAADAAAAADANSIAKSVSHEAGHAFGLSHKLTSPAGRFPLMRQGIAGTARTTWTDGANEDNVAQDDMALIARADNRFGFRADDHDDFYGRATPLSFVNRQFVGGGIIGRTTDADCFSFTAQGRVSVTVQGARRRQAPNTTVANLDTWIELRDGSTGALVATSRPSNSLDATLEANVVSGRYVVVVKSEGNYGDVGRYTVRVRETLGPRVLDSAPSRDRVRLTFNKPVDPATFTAAADISVRDRANRALTNVRLAAVAGTDNRTWDVTFTPSPSGGYRLTVGPNVADRFGNLMNQDNDGTNGEAGQDVFVLADFTGPRVTGVSHGPGRLRVTFNETIDPATFRPSSARVTDPTGANPVTVRQVVPVSGSSFDLLLDRLPTGGYRLVIQPDPADRFGNRMNQDNDAVNGEATQDRYTTTYTDRTSPRVLQAVLAEPLLGPGFPTLPATSQTLLITFSEEVDTSLFTAANVQVRGPSGVATLAGGGPVSSLTGWTYALSFVRAGIGEYTLTLSPSLADLFGNRLDQDQDSVAGEAGQDQFTARFRVDLRVIDRPIDRDLGRVLEPIDPRQPFDPRGPFPPGPGPF